VRTLRYLGLLLGPSPLRQKLLKWKLDECEHTDSEETRLLQKKLLREATTLPSLLAKQFRPREHLAYVMVKVTCSITFQCL
jgi:hypothetical protein